jgi:prepilin-type N-terminal cleavage/methylation domain-containing protein
MKVVNRVQKGFTLVEVLAVLIIVAILAGVGTPIYLDYVKSARSADAQTTISAIVTANKIHFQKFGEYASDVEVLREKRQLQLDEATKTNWSFTIGAGADKFESVRATSTENMPGGSGKQVEYKVETGEFTGYGIDE